MSKFLSYWDCNGFECIVDFTSYDRKMLMYMMGDKEGDAPYPPININHLMLRARYNPQRSPEIWVFESEVPIKDLFELSNSEPQALVDAIRANGKCIFKTSKEERVIE